MKQKLKNYLKLGILLFGVAIFIVSCYKDSDKDHLDAVSERKVSISKIPLTNFKFKDKVFETLDAFK
ncbi:MAG: hypothetical protein R2783_10315 [Gelidibacter sp.]